MVYARLQDVTNELVTALAGLHFSLPVTHVYNPLVYARTPYNHYLRRYAGAPKEIVLLGMNPGPWGMAQTGVPFGEISMVVEWLGIHGDVRRPRQTHPKRPVQGFDCRRSEVSGRRLWGWAAETFGTPDKFFARFFVANYCPLLFIEQSGRNRTPNKLKAAEKSDLLAACDQALRRTVEVLAPHCVVGIGKFAASQARQALANSPVVVGEILHPSPASPRANRGWSAQASAQLQAMGIRLP